MGRENEWTALAHLEGARPNFERPEKSSRSARDDAFRVRASLTQRYISRAEVSAEVHVLTARRGNPYPASEAHSLGSGSADAQRAEQTRTPASAG